MSVYTPVSEEEVRLFLNNFTLGELLKLEGISAGIENTNYFVTTTQGAYVLTIFEVFDKDEIPFFLDLIAFFAEHDIATAHPVADKQGRYLQTLKGKPAALVDRLKGASIIDPTVKQCAVVGETLGKMHQAGQKFPQHRKNTRDMTWCIETASKVRCYLSADDQLLLDQEVAELSVVDKTQLPQGITHGDLFRDNALFEGDCLTGIIDLYYACDELLLYDLAIVINDWCVAEDGGMIDDRVQVLMEAYQRQRKLTTQEEELFNVILRMAALRFWLSRLYDFHFPRSGEITHSKDADEFKRILQAHIIKGSLVYS